MEMLTLGLEASFKQAAVASSMRVVIGMVVLKLVVASNLAVDLMQEGNLDLVAKSEDKLEDKLVDRLEAMLVALVKFLAMDGRVALEQMFHKDHTATQAARTKVLEDGSLEGKLEVRLVVLAKFLAMDGLVSIRNKDHNALRAITRVLEVGSQKLWDQIKSNAQVDHQVQHHTLVVTLVAGAVVKQQVCIQDTLA